MGLLDSIKSGVSNLANRVENTVDKVEQKVESAATTVENDVKSVAHKADAFVTKTEQKVVDVAKSVEKKAADWWNGPPPPSGPPVVQDSYKKLTKDATVDNKIPDADARALASGTGQLGVVGQAEALKAQQTYSNLPKEDREKFQKLVDGSKSDTEKVYLYKALASGHLVSEVADFDKKIHDWSPEKMKDQLSLADDAQVDGNKADGVKQQYGDTCAPTTAQALRGEYDPIFALDVRTKAKDVNAADDTDPTKVNPDLAKAQADLLTGPGNGVTTPNGVLTTRTDGSGGTRDGDSTDAVMNTMSAHTGYTYRSDFDGTVDHKLDEMVPQLQQGIATPMRVCDADNSGGHIVLATAVQGSGASQKFLIHDPWTGDTKWVTRKQFEDNNFDLGSHSHLSSVSIATPTSP